MVERSVAADTMFGEMFELLPMGVLAVGSDGRIFCANSRFAALTGIAPMEAVGKSLEDVYAMLQAHCDPAYPSPPCPALESGQSSDDDRFACSVDSLQSSFCAGCHVVLQRPHRQLRRTVRVMDHHDSALRVLVLFEDVTRELQLDIMKSEFLIAAAHELRTPMTMIHGYAEILLLSEQEEVDANRMLRTLYRQAKGMCLLLDDLLEVARLEDMAGNAMKKEPIDLCQLVLHACGSFDAGNDPRRPSVMLDVKSAPILGNFDRLGKSLHQLLTNAYEYSFGRDGICVQVCAAPTQGWFRVAVSDRGIGMTAVEVGMAFERFWRADKCGKIPGSGLGLSLVNRVVKLHHGRAEIVSQPGAGTTVFLDFPAAQPSLAHSF